MVWKLVVFALPALAGAGAGLWVRETGVGNQAGVVLGLVLGAWAVAFVSSVFGKGKAFAWRLGCCVGLAAVSVSVVWVVRAEYFAGAAGWENLAGGLGLWRHQVLFLALVAAAAGLPGAALIGLLAATEAWSARARAGGRKRSKSALHGKSELMRARDIRKLEKARGIILGQRRRSRHAPLVAWPLEGSAMTFAPPRAGKGALIQTHFLAEYTRVPRGSTVTIDPRGELYPTVHFSRWCDNWRNRLIDPFGVMKKHKAAFPEIHGRVITGAQYNPLDYIRGEATAVQDINVLLDGLLKRPDPAEKGGRHFYESARAILAGYIAWVRFKEDIRPRTLKTVYDLLCAEKKDQKNFLMKVKAVLKKEPDFAGGLTRVALRRQEEAGSEEGGSNFSTIANQLSWLNYPELAAQTSQTRWPMADFEEMVAGNPPTDFHVIVPDELIDSVRGWLRLWVTMPNGIASRRPLDKDLTIVIDEMPRLGYMEPVMEAFKMSAGKGVHFWCFAQSLSALDEKWGKDARKTLVHLSEVVQVLGWPRTDVEGAEEMSKAMGTATFEARTESHSASMSDARVVSGANLQEGESTALTGVRIVTADDILTMKENEQYVLTSGKGLSKNVMKIRHARYWLRPRENFWSCPNPVVLRKLKAEGKYPPKPHWLRDEWNDFLVWYGWR